MLKFSSQRQWKPWPGAAKVRILLSPLGVSRRADLIRQATRTEGEGKKASQVFDPDRFNGLVADECVHGWEGIVCDEGENTPTRPLPYDKDTARALMDQEAFNAFVFQQVQTMGLQILAEAKVAGNA